MLRLTHVLRYAYNNHNNWRRYTKLMPTDAQPTQYKVDFKPGDQPQFAYKNKLQFPPEYKPHQQNINPYAMVGTVLVLFYMLLSYEQTRHKNGITYNHIYRI